MLFSEHISFYNNEYKQYYIMLYVCRLVCELDTQVYSLVSSPEGPPILILASWGVSKNSGREYLSIQVPRG